MTRSRLLTLATRADYSTLLDAMTLTASDEVAPAVIYLETGTEPTHVSRADFAHNVQRYAAGLRDMGIQPTDLVVIAHTQGLESIYSFWGAILIGAIPSMFPTLTEKLDPEIYMSGVAELVRLSGVRAVLTSDEFALQLAGSVTCPVYGSEQLRRSLASTARLSPYMPDPDDVAFLQHSSGTTGLQKGVALTHRAVLNQLASYSAAIGLDESDVIVSWLPLYHDMGLIAGFLMPLVQGIPLILMSPFDWVQHPALLFHAIHDYRGTLCWLPNFAYNHCARRIRQRDVEGISLASMRMFVNCSEPVQHVSHQMFLERFTVLGVTPHMLGVSYAMAENTFAVTQTVPGEPAHLDVIDRAELEENNKARSVAPDHPNAVIKVSCGPAIAGAQVHAVDGDGRALPERTVGELAIRSGCMLSGYYRRSDLQPLRDGWYLTGDMGYVAGREVYVIGRYKDLIINAGKNIYPQDIEAIVNDVDGVYPGRVVAFGVPDEREGTELIGVVAEVRITDPQERARIAQRVRQDVTRHSGVTVSFIHLVDSKWLIKTSSGKIARGANRKKWLAEQRSQTHQLQP